MSATVSHPNRNSTGIAARAWLLCAGLAALLVVAMPARAGAQSAPTADGAPSTPDAATAPNPAAATAPTSSQSASTTAVVPSSPPVVTAASALTLSDADVATRTAWIQHELDYNEPAAQRWFWFWTVTNTALTVGQGVLAGLMSVIAPMPQDRWGWQPGFAVGAVITAIGSVPMFIWPLPSAFAPGRLRATPQGRTPAERRARLQLAERLLRESAEAEDFGRSWAMHLIGAGLAVVSAAAVWGWVYALGAPLDTQLAQAAYTLAFGLLGSEAQILTQPNATVESWRIYRGGCFCGGAAPAHAARRARPALSVAPYFAPTGAGLTLRF